MINLFKVSKLLLDRIVYLTVLENVQMISLLLFAGLICLAGISIYRFVTSSNRLEVILPAGAILGLSIFVFILDLVSFIFRGSTGIVVSFALIILSGVLALFKQRGKVKLLTTLDYKFLFLWTISIISWGGLIYWKTANALIGSDANLYYAIAHSFVKGNFPPLTPWQPDISLSYHLGVSVLLGAFYFFSSLDFQFLHLFFSAVFIFCAAQIIIWLPKRHTTIISFLPSNLVAAVVFVSFGFIYIVWPIFPPQLPTITNINQLVIWLRNLPTVNQAIEVYGAPINLDALIYFIFHAFGLAILFSLTALLLQYKREKPLISWLVICIGLASLALVNESLFIAAFPALILGIFLVERQEKTLLKNIKTLFVFVVMTVLVVSFEGGIISSSIYQQVGIENSAMIFPEKKDVKDDFSGYHLGQEMSRLLPLESNWLPFRWFHPGIDLLLVMSLVAIFIFKDNKYSLLIRVLFVAGFSSLIAYNVIVPKFLVANGNRFLSFSFLFFSLVLCLSIVNFFEKFQKSIIKKVLLLACLGWIFIFTVLPPLALLSKTRFGENKLAPKPLQSSSGILWLEKNASFDDRVIVLDRNAPHPSGQVRALVEAGVFAPVFYGNFRAFTIEASPEYIDIAYYLSPRALKEFKVKTLLIDEAFFKILPEKRKQQLEDIKYFTKVFEYSDKSRWEKIYKIKNEYLEYGEELDGTFAQLVLAIPKAGKIYIDNEENFSPSFLRRPLIFSLRDRDLYYLPQSGVYLNVEANINFHPPKEDGDYDYLVLGKNKQPSGICKCEAKLIWKGIKDEIFVWKRDF